MPNKKSAKSKDESLRQIVEKNLAKEKISRKEPRFKKPNIKLAKSQNKADKTKKKFIFRFFSKFKVLYSPISELKLVTWPDRRTTLRLTSAVVFFSVIFGIMVSLLDWGFELVFKKVFLHG